MHSVYCFSVVADATSSCLARVIDVFALYSDLPARLVAGRDERSGGDLVIDAQLDALTADQAAAVAKRLKRVVGVMNVLWSPKRHGGSLDRAA